MNIGVIGSNFIVDRFADAASKVPELRLYCAYSRTKEQAERNREKWKTEKACWDFDALCRDPEIGAVYVASPNSCHFAQARALLQAGKHVLLEKPACLTAWEFEKLCRTAKAHGAVLMEALRTRHAPILEAVRGATGRIGPLRRAVFPYCQYSSRYDRYKNGILENAFRPEMGGGALMDIGVYSVSWMEVLLGTPKEIRALSIRLPGSIDAVTALLCGYPECLAEVSCSKVHDSLQPCVLEGELGTLTLSPFPTVRRLELALRDGTREQIAPVYASNDMEYELRDFAAACRGAGNEEESQRHTLAVLRILDEARRQCGIGFEK